MYGTEKEHGKIKLEIGFYGCTLPKGRDHAVGVCVVEVVRANQCDKRQKPCSRRHGGCPHMAACRYGTEDEPGDTKPEIGFHGGTLPKGRDRAAARHHRSSVPALCQKHLAAGTCAFVRREVWVPVRSSQSPGTSKLQLGN